jgi:hypothetical protein
MRTGGLLLAWGTGVTVTAVFCMSCALACFRILQCFRSAVMGW